MSSVANQVAQNTLWQVVTRFLGIGVAILTSRLLTSYLGEAGTGVLGITQTILTFAVIGTELGIHATVVRELAKQDSARERSRLLATATWLRLATALGAMSLVVITTSLLQVDDALKVGLIVGAPFVLLNLLWSVSDAVLQANLRMQASALAELISRVSALVLVATVVQMDSGFVGIVLAFLVLPAIISFGIKRRAAQALEPSALLPRKPSGTELRTFFLAAAPLGVVYALNYFYFRVDSIFVYGMLGATEAGYYTVAYRALEVTLFIGTYFSAALKPSFSRASQDPTKLGELLSRALPVSLFLGLATAVLTWVPREGIVLLFSNPNFLPAAAALAVLAWCIPLIYLNSLLGEVLVAVDARRALLRTSAAMVAFNLVANILLISAFGIIGAASATLLSELLLLLINLRLVQRPANVQHRSAHYARIVLVVVLAGTTGIAISQFSLQPLVELPLQLFAMALVLFAAGIGLGAVSRQDLGALQSRQS